MKIQSATALVTGANRGIGYAFVNALLQAGAQKVYAAGCLRCKQLGGGKSAGHKSSHLSPS